MESRERDKVSGLTFEMQSGKPVAVFVQSNNIKKCITYMKEHSLENVIVNSEHKYKLQHLDFLKENPFITSVEVETDIADCSALNFLHDLKSLMIHNSNSVVDFSNFPKLENLNLTWNKNFINIEKCSHLKELTIWKYPVENLQFLEAFPELEKLKIYASKIRSINGIGRCSCLRSIVLRDNRNLETINSLTAIEKTLVELVIECSRKLTDYNPIGKLINLKDLYLIGCGATPNINFIENLKTLNYGYINIDIIDGKVGALLEYPIMFKNYKHFSHKNTLKIKSVINEGNYLMRDEKILYKL